jgi:hypothetical protein
MPWLAERGERSAQVVDRLKRHAIGGEPGDEAGGMARVPSDLAGEVEVGRVLEDEGPDFKVGEL